MDALVMINNSSNILGIGIATGVAALTLTRARPLRGIRRWIQRRSDWWGELIRCPYCMSHWVSAALVVWWWPGSLRTAVMRWLIAIAIAAPVATAVYLCIQIIQPIPETLYQQPPADVGSAGVEARSADQGARSATEEVLSL